jgi:hypothetical protein
MTSSCQVGNVRKRKDEIHVVQCRLLYSFPQQISRFVKLLIIGYILISSVLLPNKAGNKESKTK